MELSYLWDVLPSTAPHTGAIYLSKSASEMQRKSESEKYLSVAKQECIAGIIPSCVILFP